MTFFISFFPDISPLVKLENADFLIFLYNVMNIKSRNFCTAFKLSIFYLYFFQKEKERRLQKVLYYEKRYFEMINKQCGILCNAVNIFQTPLPFYATQYIHHCLNSRISANHDKEIEFQPIVKFLNPLMFLQCRIFFIHLI